MSIGTLLVALVLALPTLYLCLLILATTHHELTMFRMRKESNKKFVLPRRRKKLEKIFLEGKVPAKASLLEPDGRLSEWRVDMLTGPIPNMGGKWFRHRKQIVGVGEEILGCNILFANYRWGRFQILDDGRVAYDGDKLPVLFLDYAIHGNGKVTSSIRDFVRTTKDVNVLIGRFNLNFWGRKWFLGYFSLRRL